MDDADLHRLMTSRTRPAPTGGGDPETSAELTDPHELAARVPRGVGPARLVEDGPFDRRRLRRPASRSLTTEHRYPATPAPDIDPEEIS